MRDLFQRFWCRIRALSRVSAKDEICARAPHMCVNFHFGLVNAKESAGTAVTLAPQGQQSDRAAGTDLGALIITPARVTRRVAEDMSQVLTRSSLTLRTYGAITAGTCRTSDQGRFGQRPSCLLE